MPALLPYIDSTDIELGIGARMESASTWMADL
jgi:hypothetical protein